MNNMILLLFLLHAAGFAVLCLLALANECRKDQIEDVEEELDYLKHKQNHERKKQNAERHRNSNQG